VLASGAGDLAAGATELRDGNGQLASGSAQLAAGTAGVAPGALLPWMVVFAGLALAAVGAWVVHRVRHRRVVAAPA
jgi:X-X-X-Leu-X-X-Gly heptad repeat protein